MPNSLRQRTGPRDKNPPVHDARDIIDCRATCQGDHRPTNLLPTSSSDGAAPPFPESGMGVRGRAIRLVHGPSASIETNGVATSRRPGETFGRRQRRTGMGGTQGVPRVPWGTDKSRRCHGARTSEGGRQGEERQVKPPKNPHRRAGLQQKTAGDPTRPRASPPSEGGDGNASSRVNGRGVVATTRFGGGGSSATTLPTFSF